MTDLVKLNQLQQGENNVFSVSSSEAVFNYSDGEDVEKRLYKILSTAKDLSSCSDELQSQISDWPTEYHLSPLRANLLRGFDLTGVKRVLELGCGCGAITRYLAETGLQQDLHVDSVEGSPIRAELAAMRCRDLDNVTISTANFNELVFPENYYDLVLFVGVTEYAGRFSKKETDQEALQDLLALAKNTMSEQGSLIIAIENRTGLKYILGANEDHYAKPYIGLDRYQQKCDGPDEQANACEQKSKIDNDGIRTYTQSEWQEQLHQAELFEHEFLYPFPDYKVPTVILNQRYVKNNSNAQHQLEPIRSRDYVAQFDLSYKESLYWQGIAEAEAIPQLANSFLIVSSKQQSVLNKVVDFDFIECPSFEYKTAYCLTKLQSKGELEYDLVASSELDLAHELKGLNQSKNSQSTRNLNAVWLRSLTNEQSLSAFKSHMQMYYQLLAQADLLTFDYLPSNLSADFTSRTRFWNHKQTISADLLFVRALTEFHLIYPNIVESKLASVHKWHRLVRFYIYAFQCAGQVVSEEKLEQLLQQNYEIDKQVMRSPQKIDGESLFINVVNAQKLVTMQDGMRGEPKGLTQTSLVQRFTQRLRRFFNV